ncbi:MAG TPA: DUF6766 family protein [Acidimicrobiales bacterium]|nr:DUF6766 family protein [Acidimicrobiales bacterium]
MSAIHHPVDDLTHSTADPRAEFPAVASIVVLSVYLRQQGSSESKPVHAPHHHTGAD